MNRPVLCAVSNTSGLAGIAHWINTYYRLKEDEQLDKSCDLVRALKVWVDEEYASGRVTVLTDEELVTQINKTCAELSIPVPGAGSETKTGK